MVELKIRTNISELERSLNEFVKKDLPYAVSRGLTAMAKQAQKQVRSELSRHFTIRNDFVSRGITVTPPKLSDFPHLQALISCKDSWMTEHEEGGVRQPGSLGFVAVPVKPGEAQSVRPVITQVIQPSMRAKRLLQLTQSHQNYHLIKFPGSERHAILYRPKAHKYQNQAKPGTALFAKRQAIKLERKKQTRFLWSTPKNVTLRKRWNFVATVMNTSVSIFDREIAVILQKCGMRS